MEPLSPPTSDEPVPSGITPARIAAAVPDALLGLAFLITWIAPTAFGERVVVYLMLTMLLEFIIVHSAGFMGMILFNDPLSPTMKIRALLGFSAFYLIFAAGFSLAFSAWWPLWAILLLTLNRILLVLLDTVPEGHERAFIRRGWAVTTMFYLGGAFLTIFLPLPRLGLTSSVVATLGLPGSGLWVDEPHRVIAFGCIYFLTLAVSEVFSHRWLPDATIPGNKTTTRPTSS